MRVLTSSRSTPQALLKSGRDALRQVPRLARVLPAPQGADLSRLVGVLAETVEALDGAVLEVSRLVDREVATGRAIAVEGIFEGDAPAAAGAVALWLERSRSALDEARPALENAQIAAGGLASAS